MDYGRKGVGEEAKEKITPDTQKGYGQQLSETMSGYTDKAKASFTPEDQKSTGQQMHDTARGTADDTQNDNRSMMDKAKDAMGMGGGSK
ncbi:hypothetical protein M427DRAFT_156784 [Gonapodya prolifera JEL478]|uniref:Uncharacterized protein n=1 Tax=Gonapodya prolifera (strain JEL478) TaxID=1344416 RepID=A0A139A911_GONPJ|nr:hypothetical protein M427DRAFT_156784 [Gonapodya prolifera JEL478]|eukprot:KXS13246.1 hypothetical protein M427DRAFT_156784 [Gonapodya prolifera JEL478]